MAWLSRVMLFVASAETVMVSLTFPTSSLTSARAIPEALRMTPVRSAFLKLVVTTSMR